MPKPTLAPKAKPAAKPAAAPTAALAPDPVRVWKIAVALAIGIALFIVAGNDLSSLRATVVGCAVIVSLVPFIGNAIASALDWLRDPSPKTRTLIAVGIGILGGFYLFTTAAIFQGRTLVPKMEDECSYVIGAQLLARGHLWMHAHPLADFFEALFIIVKPVYCSIYFPGTSIFYAPMVWLHLPSYVMPLVVSGAVIAMLYRVVTELMDGVAGLLACFWIIALSEFRTLSVMVMSHLPMLLLGLLMVWAWLRWRENRRWRWALVLGIFSGWAAITRPADAVVYALPIGIAMIAALWKNPRELLLPALALVIGAALFLTLQIIFDKGVTGKALESPYTYSLKLDQPGTQYGFHHYDPDASPPTKHIGKQGYYLWCKTFLKNHQFPQVLKRWVFSEGNNLGPHQSYFMIAVNNALPSHLLLILIPVGLLAMRDRRQLVLIATFFAFCVIYFFNPFFLEHYLMVVVPAVALMALRGSRIVVGRRFAPALGVPMTVAILALSLTSFWEFKRLSFGEFDLAVQDGKEGMLESSKLSVVDEQLPTDIGSTRAVVLFGPLTSSYFEEPVYNTDVANIDNARIIRAHDMGARNVEIIRYYAERQPDRVFYMCDIRGPIIDRLGTGPELLAKLRRGEALPTLVPQQPPRKPSRITAPMSSEINETERTKDAWSEWLLNHRHAGDAAYQRVVRGMIERIRDRVLDGARLRAGMTLADIGTGDGFIGFGAIARIGESLRVILTDISHPLLEHARHVAQELNVVSQCAFLEGSAEKLVGIEDSSIDVLTTRAVLAYVADKPAAFREFHRVLKPGGRISIAEPIFRDQALEALALTKAFGAQPPQSIASFPHLLQRWKAAQFPSTEQQISQSPIANYTERDLFRLAREAGFVDLHLELHIDERPSSVTSWEVFLNTAPHPLAPSAGDILSTQFSEAERQLFERVMRPQIESGKSLETDAIAYLTAAKPPMPPHP